MYYYFVVTDRVRSLQNKTETNYKTLENLTEGLRIIDNKLHLSDGIMEKLEKDLDKIKSRLHGVSKEVTNLMNQVSSLQMMNSSIYELNNKCMEHLKESRRLHSENEMIFKNLAKEWSKFLNLRDLDAFYNKLNESKHDLDRKSLEAFDHAKRILSDHQEITM